MKIEEEALENAANCLGKHLNAVIAAFEKVQSELESSEVFDTQK